MNETAADTLNVAGVAAEGPASGGAGARTPRAVAGERTISPVAGRPGLTRSGRAAALLGLVGGCAVFLAATCSPPRSRSATKVPPEAPRQVIDWASVKGASRPLAVNAPKGPPGPAGARAASPPGAAPTLVNPGPDAPSLVTPFPGPVVPALSLAEAEPAGAEPAGGAPDAASATGEARRAAAGTAAAQATRLQTTRSAPLLVYSATTREAAAGADAAPLTSPIRAGDGAAPSELDQLRRGSAIGLVRAQRLPDRTFLLAAGALLPCVLETAVDTSAPGFVTCRLSRDIYSDNGALVLMEKGSRVMGEYRSGFSQGRARIFVLWDRITTPGGVAVDVSSPASDALGRAGFDGTVDSHFWPRFGGALLLTTLGGGLSALATADARVANVAQAPNEAASAALQTSVAIAPTLTKPQGAEVAIFVSRDLDFSTVYALKAR